MEWDRVMGVHPNDRLRDGIEVFGRRISWKEALWPAIPPHPHPDLVIREGRVLETPPFPPFALGADPLSFSWPDLARFRIESGCRITVEVLPHYSEQSLRMVLRGVALPLALAQSGMTLLHSSCVRIGGGAVAIAGRSGEGKSTLAAALVSRGHSLLSDGLTAIDRTAETPNVLPGPPVVRLRADAAAHLSSEAIEVETRSDGLDKHVIATPTAADATPLVAILNLADGNAVAMSPLSGARAAAHLAANAFLLELIDRSSLKLVMRQFATICSAVRVTKLERPRRLKYLPALLDLIESLA